MAISTVVLDGNGVGGPGNDGVDYLTDGDANDHINTNRPIANLAARDAVLRDALNIVIGDINAAAGSAVDLAARIDLEHNPDGSHTGGSPHPKVVVAPGHPYLTIVDSPTAQTLNANVGAVAGTLCAGDDARLGGQGFALVAAAGGDYLTPKAALDAGETKILIAPGTYADAAAVSVSTAVVMIGIGVVHWDTQGVTVVAGGDYSSFTRIDFQSTSGAVPLTLSNVSMVGLDDIKVTPNQSVDGLVAVSATKIVIRRFDSTAVQNAAGGYVSGIRINDGCSEWFLYDINAEMSAPVGGNLQVAIYFDTIAFTGFHLEKLRVAYSAYPIIFASASVSVKNFFNIHISDVYAKNCNPTALGMAVTANTTVVTATFSNAAANFVNISISRIFATDPASPTAAAAQSCVRLRSVNVAQSITIRDVYGMFEPMSSGTHYGVQIGAPSVSKLNVSNVNIETTGEAQNVVGLSVDANVFKHAVIKGVHCVTPTGATPGYATTAVQITTLGITPVVKHIEIGECSSHSEFAKATGVYIEVSDGSLSHVKVHALDVESPAADEGFGVYVLLSGASATGTAFSYTGSTVENGQALYVNCAGLTDAFSYLVATAIACISTSAAFASAGTWTSGMLLIAGNTYKTVSLLSSGTGWLNGGSNSGQV